MGFIIREQSASFHFPLPHIYGWPRDFNSTSFSNLSTFPASISLSVRLLSARTVTRLRALSSFSFTSKHKNQRFQLLIQDNWDF